MALKNAACGKTFCKVTTACRLGMSHLKAVLEVAGVETRCGILEEMRHVGVRAGFIRDQMHIYTHEIALAQLHMCTITCTHSCAWLLAAIAKIAHPTGLHRAQHFIYCHINYW